MSGKTAFIGHREVFCREEVRARVDAAITEELEKGCRTFMMGTHGQFDELALSACREARREHPEMKIIVVFTSFRLLEKRKGFYEDVERLTYETEEAYFKRRIILSNRKMIDECDKLICYVNTEKYRSGAKTAIRYAEKMGLDVVDLYRKEDSPFYGMSEEEKRASWEKFLEQTAKDAKHFHRKRR